MVVGFEVAEVVVEETVVSNFTVQVVLLQNIAAKQLTVGLQTFDGSAKG